MSFSLEDLIKYGGKIMNNNLYKLFSRLIIEKLSMDHVIEDQFLREMDFAPLIDNLRIEIKQIENGKEVIKKLLNSKSDSEIVLGLNLSKSYLKNDKLDVELLEILDEIMKSKNTFWVKINIIIRLLDLTKYNNSHKDFVNFIFENNSEFTKYVPLWTSGFNSIEDFVQQRLKDKNFPKTKSWFYIIMLAHVKSKNEIIDLLKKHNNESAIVSIIENNI